MSAETDVSRSAARRLIRLKSSRGRLNVIFRFSVTRNSVAREIVEYSRHAGSGLVEPERQQHVARP